MPIKHEDFFEIIDSEDKAYFLGFMLADGCIDDCKQLRARLQLSEPDEYIIHEFAKRIGSNNKITRKKAKKITSKDGIIRNSQPSHCIVLNKAMAEDLMRLGITPRKSFSADLFWEKIPSNLIHHVVRGIFDGNGTISNKKRDNAFEVNIATSIQTGKKIQEIVKKHLGVEASIKKDGSIFRVSFTSYYDMNEFLQWIYNCDSSLMLTRKYERFLRLKQEKKDSLFERVELVSYREAKKLVSGLAQTKNEWNQLCKNKKQPRGVPANPRLVYIKSGHWKGFADFLGK